MNWEPAGILVMVFLFVPPVPVLLLLGRAPAVEVLVAAVRVMFPLRVVGLLGGPHMIVVVIRVVDAGVNCASCGEDWSDDGRREQELREFPEDWAHGKTSLDLVRKFRVSR